MCDIIVINKGEKEITSPREFKEHFGFDVGEDIEEEWMDACLCNYFINEKFIEHKIPFEFDGDYYIEQDLTTQPTNP